MHSMSFGITYYAYWALDYTKVINFKNQMIKALNLELILPNFFLLKTNILFCFFFQAWPFYSNCIIFLCFKVRKLNGKNRKTDKGKFGRIDSSFVTLYWIRKCYKWKSSMKSFCHIFPTSCSSKTTSTSSTATTASSATTPPGGENLMIRAGGDMSRRKQKNPKPFFTSNEDQDDQQHQQQQQQHRREVEEDNKSSDGQNNNLNSR